MSSDRPDRVAAVCYRVSPEPSFLLVTTKGSSPSRQLWTFPKGRIEPGERVHDAAAREAKEEAGVLGRIDPEPLTRYRYSAGTGALGRPLEVEAYLLEVQEEGPPSPGERLRRRAWFSPADAERHLAEHRSAAVGSEHRRVIGEALEAIAGARSGP